MAEEKKKLFSGERDAGDDFNKARKFFHLTGLIIPAIYFFDLFDYIWPIGYKENTRTISFFILSGLVIFMVIIEILRFNFPFWQDLFMKTIGKILKEKEEYKVHGGIPVLFAATLLVGFFPKEVAGIAILYLIIGDPFAAYIGGKFGTVRLYNSKSLQGMLAGVFMAFLSGLGFVACIAYFDSFLPNSDLYLWSENGINHIVWILLLVTAVIAYTLELFSTDGFFDDNILIPIGSALFLCFTMAYLENRDWFYYFYSWEDLLIN